MKGILVVEMWVQAQTLSTARASTF